MSHDRFSPIAIARRLKGFQENRPTFSAVFWRIPGPVGVMLVGSVSTAVLAIASQMEGIVVPHEWVVACGSVYLGAILRDAGFARAHVRSWPTMESLIDWHKVDETLTESPE